MRKLKLSLKKEIISDLEAENVKGGALSQHICYPISYRDCPPETAICMPHTDDCFTYRECESEIIKCKP